MTRLWYYRYPGGFHALGPVEARNEQEARQKIRGDKERLPTGTEVWETSRKAIDYIVENNWRMRQEIGQPLD